MTKTFLDALAEIVRRELAKLGIITLHEYRVVQQAGARVDLQIVQRSAGLPDQPRVLARPAAGYSMTFTPGTLVLVGFVAGDATRPFIAHGGEVGEARTIPSDAAVDATASLTLGASAGAVDVGHAAAPVIRDGDTVAIDPLTARISLLSGTAETPPAVSILRA